MMSNSDSTYRPIFKLNALDEKVASSSRKVHLRRLNDILHLSIERGDLPRAHRAWSILARCMDFDWKTKWRTALLLLSGPSSSLQHHHGSGRSVEWLRKLMRYYPDEQEAILQEIILCLADSGKFKEALDELDFYLSSVPYHENAVLHCYAGLLSLKLAASSDTASLDSGFLSEARKHLKRALSLDPDNPVAKAFAEEVDKQLAQSGSGSKSDPINAPSDEEMDVDNESLRGKRLRMASEQ